MTILLLRPILLCGTFLMSVFAASVAYAGVPIKINAWGIHQGGQIVYRYQIENNSASTIHQLSLGLNSLGKELPGPPWSLNPVYAEEEGPFPLDVTQCKPFFYMDCTVSVIQFDHMPEPKTIIDMEGLENNLTPPPKVFSGAGDIRPGTLSSVAELYIPAAHQSLGYLTAYGEVFLLDNNTKNPDGTIVTLVEIPFTQVDVTPPTLTINPTPAILWPPNNKMVAVTAAITVQDDYDPQPEIKLESITSSEVLAQGDIQGAVLGTDDRQFSLAAERDGSSLAGGVYTLTYSATDGSGNKSTASTTVTVPHDQR